MKPLLCALVAISSIAMPWRAIANLPGGGTQGDAPTLTHSGANVILSNGIVTATINPNTAEISSLQYKGHEMVSQSGRHVLIYFFLDGDKGYDRFSNCVMTIRQPTPDMIDLGFKRTYNPQDPKEHPCDVDTHLVLGRGMSGLYAYSILDHPATYPVLNIAQYLMIWSQPIINNQWLMERIYVDRARHWDLPSPPDLDKAQATGIKEIVKLTSGPWQGKYDCKYMYTAPYWDLGTWGFASNSNKIGGWIVFGSHEFFNDGPTMSDLTAATGITQLMFNMNHYNGAPISIPQGQDWHKVYGPYLIYCNSSEKGADDCWADAQRQAIAEQSAWPYQWVGNDKLYPTLHERGTVTGTFKVSDPLKPNATTANAWIGLAQPKPGGDWQLDNQSYQYWAHADASGRFTIPNIRPGTYTLFAFTKGAVGQFSQPNITITAGQTNTLGTLTWQAPHPGASIAWEIGVPDRTAGEFRHSDDYFKPYLWEQFAGEFTNPLEYTVGKSDWHKDWNYVQCGYLSGTTWTPWKWRIHFDLKNPPATGMATLTLAYASSYYGHT
jgi:rhamnogalacturonan endolyase